MRGPLVCSPPSALLALLIWLPWCPDAKYLGLHLERCFTWWMDSKQVAWKTASHPYKLFPLVCITVMFRHLEQTHVVTVILLLTYMISVWGYLAKTYKQKLQSLMDRIMCLACKAQYFTWNQTIHTVLGVNSLNITIWTLSRKFYCCCPHFQGNPLISALGQYPCVPNESCTCPWWMLTLN